MAKDIVEYFSFIALNISSADGWLLFPLRNSSIASRWGVSLRPLGLFFVSSAIFLIYNDSHIGTNIN